MMKSSLKNDKLITWLLWGDPSIRWQVMRDLLDASPKIYEKERKKISREGWGRRLLSLQDADGRWSQSLYSRKWISATYTMLLLKDFGLDPENNQSEKACKLLLNEGFYKDEGINYFASLKHSETCVTGMILSILSYFNYKDERVNRLVAHLLNQQMRDGGWNCRSFIGDTHSSFNTTILVLEGLREYEKRNDYEKIEVRKSMLRGVEFLLEHKLFRSHRTGKVVNSNMTRFSFPPRWHYDILRALDYFQEACIPYDERMSEALEIVLEKQGKDGKWFLQNRHPGKTFFELEQVGKPSRWNTLRALRVLRKYLFQMSLL